MGTYRATINIAGFKVGEVKTCPETPRIAALVREGFLTSLAPPLLSYAEGVEELPCGTCGGILEQIPEGDKCPECGASRPTTLRKAGLKSQGQRGGH